MRTTFDIDDSLLEQVVEITKSKTKKGAIVIALNEFLQAKRRESLKARVNNGKGFGLSLKDLEKLRAR